MSDATTGNVTTPAEPGRDPVEDRGPTTEPVPTPRPGESPTTEPEPGPSSGSGPFPDAEPAPQPEPEPGDEPEAEAGSVNVATEAVSPDGPVGGDGPAVASDRAPEDGVVSDRAPEDGVASDSAPVGDFRLALVSAVKVDLPNQHPTVVLRETESPRRQLSFSVGLQDGVVLSHAMRRIPTPRPLTHELLSGILQGFDIDIVAVRLVGRQGAIYFAELDLRGRTGRSVHSCRPSDALTIALHQPVPVPILIDRRLLEQSGDVAPAGSTSPST